MNTKYTLIALFAVVLITVTLTSQDAVSAESETELDTNTSRVVRLSGNAFVTQNLAASIDFYSNFLGFEVVREFELTAAASKEIYGVNDDRKILYAALKPKGWPLDTPNLTGLNFAQIETANKNPVAQEPQRAPFYGEFILTYEVREIEKIESEMRKKGVPIVTPLKPSGTGKSMTLTVLDPNGIRVHLYDYI